MSNAHTFKNGLYANLYHEQMVKEENRDRKGRKMTFFNSMVINKVINTLQLFFIILPNLIPYYI